MVRTSRWQTLLLAAIAVGVLPLLALLLAAPSAVMWSEGIAAAVSAWNGGGWRLLRGGLAWLAAPATLAVVLWCLLRMLRTGRTQDAATAFVLALGSFLMSEAFKLNVLPLPGYGPDGDRNISGHVAMVAGALIVVVIAAPTARRWLVAALASTIVVLTSLGVVAARWHDAGDLIVPLMVATAWSVVARALFVLREHGESEPSRRRVVQGAAALALVCALAAWYLVSRAGALSGTLALLAALLAVLAATIATALAAIGVAEILDNRSRST